MVLDGELRKGPQGSRVGGVIIAVQPQGPRAGHPEAQELRHFPLDRFWIRPAEPLLQGLPAAALERLAIVQVWRNFMKSFSERRRDPTPAQRLGLADRRLSVGEVLEKRLFASRIRLPAALERYYRRTVVTPALGSNRVHRLVYAD